jgi:cytochrome c oxidase subunit IV
MNDEQTPRTQQGHEHPDNKTYLFIAGVLTVVTAMEFGALYTPSFAPILVPLLLSLSAAKFALVVMFYMHLKPDRGLFTLIFLLPLGLAVVVILFLMALLR